MNKTILSKLKEADGLYDKYNIAKIYLAGSYARGEENKDSDVDLYFKTTKFLDIYNYMNFKFDLEKKLGKNVDLIMDDNLKSGVKEYLLKDLVLIK